MDTKIFSIDEVTQVIHSFENTKINMFMIVSFHALNIFSSILLKGAGDHF